MKAMTAGCLHSFKTYLHLHEGFRFETVGVEDC